MKPHPWLVVVFAGALIGAVFAGLSTHDFVQHLDRQVHSLHCSFIPGAEKQAGESGCQVAMMSEYSSVLRSRVWGGIPISLPAMAVFLFLGCFAIDLLLTRRKDDPRATAFLALAAGVPAAASLIMLFISLSRLGTTCTMCVAIYAASALCLIGAIGLWRRAVRLARAGGPPIARPAPRRARKEPHGDEPAFTGAASAGPASAPAAEPADEVPRTRLRPSIGGSTASNLFLAAALGAGVAFVALPVLVYVAMAPDHGRFVGTCDVLPKPEDTYGVMVRVDRDPGRVPAIEILDPLCPACAAFERRLASSGYRGELDRRAILFPLDSTCNWMVTEATHPGACTVSEAVLCAGARAPEVIAWAFEEGERIRAASKTDPAAAARIVRERFPDLASCVGSPEARARLNKSLRWAVANNIRVLTPQLFVGNAKLCDEDVDLGLAYSLRVMLERHAAGTLVAPGAATAGKPAEAPDPSADKASKPATAGTVKPDKPAASGTVKPDKPAASGADKPAASGTDKPAASGTDRPEIPAASGTDQPASGTETPAASGADKPAPSGTDKPAASGTDQPADKPDKPIEPAAPSDQPITSPSQAPAGGAP